MLLQAQHGQMCWLPDMQTMACSLQKADQLEVLQYTVPPEHALQQMALALLPHHETGELAQAPASPSGSYTRLYTCCNEHVACEIQQS